VVSGERSQAASSGRPCWVLVGPTASGKTELALRLGAKLPLEVVSVDSMQVYRGMDIGTAKPSAEERRLVPHHMVDVVEPDSEFNAARYREMAVAALEEIRLRGRQALLVCGSPLYLKALLWGLFEGPGADPRVRGRLRREAQEKGSEALHRRLSKVDPEAAMRIAPADLRRIERALEVYELTGRPISSRQKEFEGRPQIPYVAVGLRWGRRALGERIERRADQMMELGLLDEVKALRDRLGSQARQAVGYKELIAYLDGECSLEEAVELLKRNTRRLAKGQMTWFRRLPDVHWIDVSGESETEELAERCRFLFSRLEHCGSFGYD